MSPAHACRQAGARFLAHRLEGIPTMGQIKWPLWKFHLTFGYHRAWLSSSLTCFPSLPLRRQRPSKSTLSRCGLVNDQGRVWLVFPIPIIVLTCCESGKVDMTAKLRRERTVLVCVLELIIVHNELTVVHSRLLDIAFNMVSCSPQ